MFHHRKTLFFHCESVFLHCKTLFYQHTTIFYTFIPPGGANSCKHFRITHFLTHTTFKLYDYQPAAKLQKQQLLIQGKSLSNSPEEEARLSRDS